MQLIYFHKHLKKNKMEYIEAIEFKKGIDMKEGAPLKGRVWKLETQVEELQKELAIHKAQIRKLFNITTKLGEKVYGTPD